MIAEPPFPAGALNVTVACAFPAIAMPMTGAPGTVAGVTALEAEDAGPLPTALVAITVKVYDVPLVRPVTVMGEDALGEEVPPGGLEMTV